MKGRHSSSPAPSMPGGLEGYLTQEVVDGLLHSSPAFQKVTRELGGLKDQVARIGQAVDQILALIAEAQQAVEPGGGTGEGQEAPSTAPRSAPGQSEGNTRPPVKGNAGDQGNSGRGVLPLYGELRPAVQDLIQLIAVSRGGGQAQETPESGGYGAFLNSMKITNAIRREAIVEIVDLVKLFKSAFLGGPEPKRGRRQTTEEEPELAHVLPSE